MSKQNSYFNQLMIAMTVFLAIGPSALSGFMEPEDFTKQGPRFKVEHRIKATGSKDSVLAELTLQIPYDELLFLKDKSIYQAHADISVFLYANDLRIAGESWNEVISVKDFESTNSRREALTYHKQFVIPIDDYEVRVVVTDLQTQQNRRYTDQISLLSMKGKSWILGDLWYIEPDIPDTSDEVPDYLSFMFSAAGISADNQLFEFKVYTSQGKVAKYGRFTVNLHQEPTEYLFKIKSEKLAYQPYGIEISTKVDNADYERKSRFQVNWGGMSTMIPDLNEAIRQMRYLMMTNFITNKEYDQIMNSSEEMKRKVFTDYWQSIDPTPRTKRNEIMDEYYHRIEIANQRFGSYKTGWETDRGMVYTIFGPPDDEENHTYELSTKPYIIWYYYSMNRQFVFMDYSGFGDFQLTQPVLDLNY